jgi:hypothetical protein
MPHPLPRCGRRSSPAASRRWLSTARRSKACVDLELNAVDALDAYPATADPIIARCTAKMRDLGWSIIKACADLDLKAAEALRTMNTDPE